ncbi:ankyrin [Pleurostoma richardsiae]|uniref:Ankyrin n=1 Tax=Pleurostoma richardsiae TaxID=41990 RepID=A0AA38VX55_9PEZI|nr:ankyrin [Pleurostoma richardsiae]
MDLRILVTRFKKRDRKSRLQENNETPVEAKYGLFTLAEPKPGEQDKIDIIAIHGLGGDRLATWKHSCGRVWLRDFLPLHFPNARIMTFGYNSAVAFSKSIASIDDFAVELLERLTSARRAATSRPLVFICHSMGGIVVKKALIIAHERSSHYSAILKSVAGVVFMATPHRGSAFATWGSIVARMIRLAQFGSGTNAELLSTLANNSKELQSISGQFVERGQGMKIVTFYETEALEYTNSPIVDKDSAVLNIPNERLIPMRANHRTICQFPNEDSQEYLLVKEALEAIIEQTSSIEPEAPKLSSTSYKELLQFLHQADYEGYKETIPRRTDGTRIWFLEHPLYRSWLNGQESSLLWVSGDPGCGKTVLAKFILETLEEASSIPGSSFTTCYFFFDEKIASQNTGSSCLLSILHQLIRKHERLAPHARKAFEYKDTQLVMRVTNLWDVFTEALENHAAGNVICIVDALDECDASSRDRLIERMSAYIERRRELPGPYFKLLLTSRGYQTIEDAFKTVPHIRLKTEAYVENINQDIVLFTEEQMKVMQRITGCSDQVRKRIQDQLIEKADQTFLWVSLVLDMLTKSTDASEYAFNKLLRSFPAQLDDMYEEILQSSKEPQTLLRILAILVGAPRPMTLTELNMALSLRNTDRSKADVQPRMQFDVFRRLKGVCGPFIKLVNEKVYLIHQTAKEFLLRPPGIDRPLPSTWKHCLDPAWMHGVLAEICVVYLCFDDFAVPLTHCDKWEGDFWTMDVKTAKYAEPYDLLDYAARYWALHFRLAGKEVSEQLWEAAYRLCNTQECVFTSWFQLYWSTIARDWPLPKGLTPLMIASYLGLRRLVDACLQSAEETTVNVPDTHGYTALHWAVWQGHGVTWDGTEAVKPLLDAGANVNVKDARDMTPLHWAAADGQNAIIRLLLDAGAELNCLDTYGQTPLDFAYFRGREDTARLLMDLGAVYGYVAKDGQDTELEDAEDTESASTKVSNDEGFVELN